MDGIVDMYIDRNEISQYPFIGKFITTTIDTSKPLDEQVEEDVVLLETECDIQESTKSLSGGITATYAVYFPFDKEKGIGEVKNGIRFEGDLYGLRVNGEVKGIFPTQMGGCVAYIVDKDV